MPQPVRRLPPTITGMTQSECWYSVHRLMLNTVLTRPTRQLKHPVNSVLAGVMTDDCRVGRVGTVFETLMLVFSGRSKPEFLLGCLNQPQTTVASEHHNGQSQLCSTRTTRLRRERSRIPWCRCVFFLTGEYFDRSKTS